ncbi:calcium-activated potassium channel subunit beta-3 isoform X3 [Salminus brasiliensis]|uniref:calcium-activated potassium channel subunit beta-3 isoform X3 n=1 Tax=Salminus brasiliensis TaxID=930266 RepID=UPI003B8392B6
MRLNSWSQRTWPAERGRRPFGGADAILRQFSVEKEQTWRKGQGSGSCFKCGRRKGHTVGIHHDCLLHPHVLCGWNCCCEAKFPQVFVDITAFGRRARLHYDEVVVNLNPECFYTPKSQQNKSELVEEAQKITEFWLSKQGQVVRCHPSMGRHPEDVILNRRYTLHLALQCLVWPSLMLFGGGLLVGLVKLTQCLAHLCTEINTREGGEGGQAMLTQGKLYHLLSCRPGSPSIEQDPGS